MLRIAAIGYSRIRLDQTELLYFHCTQFSSFDRALACSFIGRIAILEFFSTRKVSELGRSLALDVARRYPPAIANNPAQMVSPQRLSGILAEVFESAARFSRVNKLGWYKRARLGKDFRWELNELGYDEKFVNTATEGLILCVTRKPESNT